MAARSEDGRLDPTSRTLHDVPLIPALLHSQGPDEHLTPLGLNKGMYPDIRIFISPDELRDLGFPSDTVDKLNVALAGLGRGLDLRALTSTGDGGA